MPRGLVPRAIAVMAVGAAGLLCASPAAAQTDPDACRLVQTKPPQVSFVGRVVSAKDGLVVFAVDHLTTGTLGAKLKAGRVTILYPDHEDRFLEVGKSYRVPADTTGYGLTSSVHTAQHPCQNDNTTVNADGSVIPTGVFAHAKGPLLRYTLQFTAGFAGLFLLVFLLSRLARRARQD